MLSFLNLFTNKKINALRLSLPVSGTIRRSAHLKEKILKSYNVPKNVSIIYFSGTGGTRKAARRLADSFRKISISDDFFELCGHADINPDTKTDMIIIL